MMSCCTTHVTSSMMEVRASQLAQASERVGSPIPVSQQGRNVGKVFNPVVKLVLENQPFLASSVAVRTDTLADYHSVAVYYSCEGRIHLY